MLKWLKWIIPVAALVGMLIYQAPRPTFVPRTIWGRWVTDEARYTDRHLDISESVLAFGQGGSEIRVMIIEQVEKKALTGGDLYMLYYRDEDGDLQWIHLQYTENYGGQLQIASQQEVVWHREIPGDDS